MQKSCETKKPVRVIRGYKLHSEYAPAEGYRYDGLYTVEKVRVRTLVNEACVLNTGSSGVDGERAEQAWLPRLQVRPEGLYSSSLSQHHVVLTSFFFIAHARTGASSVRG